MDTLDKITSTTDASADAFERDFNTAKSAAVETAQHTLDDVADTAEDLANDTVEAVRAVNWWKVAGYAALGLAAAGAAGGYLYYREQQKKPQTRLAKLKSQLGLADVDFRDLKSTINRFDYDRLDQSRRQLGTYAKKATHKGAKKVAELTR